VGILFGSRYWWIEGVMGIFVSLALFYAAYGIIKESAQSIMGEEPDTKLIQKLEHISFEVIGQDVHLHHIHIHNYGDHTELTCHIKLQPELTLHNAHEIATKIENAIREETGIIATIHMEPKKLNV
jgi:divalent metal cation (Fe/Co/Zn/Cd) transporter